ncbi:MAG: hypothetical protein RIR51_370, partial [Bacteroidota bacterium]
MKFKHVSYLWDDEKASKMSEVELFIYRSNILGADLRITNYGGGNTSVKIQDNDPLTGNKVDVMWIKGSGGDIGTLKLSGCAALYVDRLRSLENVYKGIEMEDQMVELFNHCIFDLNSKAPSIDTPLHGFLPFKHIDHLHPDAAIAIAAAKDGEKITKELFGGKIGWVPWQRPGFDLGLQLRKCLEDAKAEGTELIGIMLGSHGLFTWADNAKECYINTLEVIEACAEYIDQKIKANGQVFGGQRTASLSEVDRKSQSIKLAPILRGFCSSERKMIGHFNDDPRVLEYINSVDLDKLAPMGTSCPDHFLRTKIAPLVLNLSPDENLDDTEAIKSKIAPLIEEYRQGYQEYYNTCKHPNSPAIRDSNPVVILYPGVGMFTFAKDKQTARVASEFYLNAINVMRGSEAISEYTSLPRQEAFDIEYWLLEEAKLQRMPAPKSLSGRIAIVTGSGGGIGKAIAEKFLQNGAVVSISDINPERVNETVQEFKAKYGKDNVEGVICDVTNQESIEAAYNE